MTQSDDAYTKAQKLKLAAADNIDQPLLRQSDTINRQTHRLQLIEWRENSAYIYGTGSVSTKDIKSTFPSLLFLNMTAAFNEICRLNVYADITIVDIIQIISQHCRFSKTNFFSPNSLLEFHDHCRRNNLTHFNKMKTFIFYWNNLSPGAIDEKSIIALQSCASVKPPRPSGSNVRSDDESEGWLNDEEYYSVIDTIWFDYESGINSLWNTTASLLCAQYGRRPIQLAHLKIKDLSQKSDTERYIEFPGAKDQNSEGFRLSKFEIHPIGDHLWQMCQRLAKESINEFEKLLGPLSYNLQKELPLFYPRSQLTKRIEIVNALYSNKQDQCTSRILHTRAKRMSTVLRRSTGTHVWSSRTNDYLEEYAYRFRYTRARQLARLGVSKATLSFWLGHDSRKSLDAYYDDPAERARVLDDGISNIMAPLAQAFRGRLIRNKSEATRAGDERSLIELEGKDDSAVGNCGSSGFCTASVPIPCYRCTKFEPWLDGPHEEVLQRLLERQNEENMIPLPGSGRRLLTPLQLDRDIQAVVNVINHCKKAKLLDEQQTHIVTE
jgi:integrase